MLSPSVDRLVGRMSHIVNGPRWLTFAVERIRTVFQYLSSVGVATPVWHQLGIDAAAAAGKAAVAPWTSSIRTPTRTTTTPATAGGESTTHPRRRANNLRLSPAGDCSPRASN